MTRRESPTNGMTTDPQARAEEVLAATGLVLDRGPYVADWPSDEIALHRNGPWRDFSEREAILQAHRRLVVVAALVEAGLLADDTDFLTMKRDRDKYQDYLNAARAELADLRERVASLCSRSGGCI